MTKAATTVTKTAGNATSFLRFMSLSFHELSFGRDTMDGAPDGYSTYFIRCVARRVVGLRIARLGKKQSPHFCLHCRGGRTPEIMRERQIRMARGESRGPHKISSRPGRQPG